MSGYLSTLVSRTLRPGDAVQPRLRSLFAPPTPGYDGPQMSAHSDEVVARPETFEISEVFESTPQIPARDPELRQEQASAPAASQTEPASAPRKASTFANSPTPRRESPPKAALKDDLIREAEIARANLPAPKAASHEGPQTQATARAGIRPWQPQPTSAKDEPTSQISSRLHEPPLSATRRAIDPTQLATIRIEKDEVMTSPARAGRTKPQQDSPRTSAGRNSDKHPSAAERRHLPERESSFSLSPFAQDVPSLTSARKRESESSSGARSPIFVRSRAMESPLMAPAPAPTIEVTIGRVEVRATPVKESSKPTRPTSPVVGLDEYLRRRSDRSSG